MPRIITTSTQYNAVPHGEIINVAGTVLRFAQFKSARAQQVLQTKHVFDLKLEDGVTIEINLEKKRVHIPDDLLSIGDTVVLYGVRASSAAKFSVTRCFSTQSSIAVVSQSGVIKAYPNINLPSDVKKDFDTFKISGIDLTEFTDEEEPASHTSSESPVSFDNFQLTLMKNVSAHSSSPRFIAVQVRRVFEMEYLQRGGRKLGMFVSDYTPCPHQDHRIDYPDEFKLYLFDSAAERAEQWSLVEGDIIAISGCSFYYFRQRLLAKSSGLAWKLERNHPYSQALLQRQMNGPGTNPAKETTQSVKESAPAASPQASQAASSRKESDTGSKRQVESAEPEQPKKKPTLGQTNSKYSMAGIPQFDIPAFGSSVSMSAIGDDDEPYTSS